MMNLIRYNQPAKKWREALPLGNGITGIMVFGSLKKERLCFNDGTLWSGYPKNYDSPASLENLEKVRELIFAGKNSEADALCQEKLTGFYSEAFMPLGDVLLKFKNTDKKNERRIGKGRIINGKRYNLPCLRKTQLQGIGISVICKGAVGSI